jgi:AmmeMemoRadiSam system protein A
MNDKTDTHPYVWLARTTISRLLRGEELPAGVVGEADGGDQELWRIQRACFVSIKTLHGDLRGCIGTILPSQPSLDLEIISNSVAASTRDPRFPPMKAPELENVALSVDVLSLPEPVSALSELDPALWGVIVSRGALRGVLLPDLEGVDTVQQQLDIAARKAGIRKIDDGVTIERFRVDRYKE